jgi:hypothetical protein
MFQNDWKSAIQLVISNVDDLNLNFKSGFEISMQISTKKLTNSQTFLSIPTGVLLHYIDHECFFFFEVILTILSQKNIPIVCRH